MNKTIQQGAEALISQKNSTIIKDRVKKSYRLPSLDLRLRKQRTKKESRLLEKASRIIPVPKIVSSDNQSIIIMSHLAGLKLSDNLDKLSNSISICKLIGQNLAKLHDNNIIHGDLTTSNMIYSSKENLVYFIDFGLGFESDKIEDKAVDLHLIKQALEAKHFDRSSIFFKSILAGYKSSHSSTAVIKRLEIVEKRGRYKQSY